MRRHQCRQRRFLFDTLLLAAIVSCCLMPPLALAWTPSPDVGTQLGGSAYSAADVIANGALPATTIDLGPLPDGANVVAFSMNDVADLFFVLGHTMELPGAIPANPQTIMEYDRTSGTYAEVLDLGDFGLPRNVAIDALGLLFGSQTIGVSFDTTVEFLGVVIEDDDVFDIFTGVTILDASAAGIGPGLDLDAFAEASNGDFLVSFDTGGSVGGIAFADEDVLRVTHPGHVWSMEVDASATDTGWERADMNALHVVPEPGLGLQWAAGLAGLLAITRLRTRPRALATPHSRRS